MAVKQSTPKIMFGTGLSAPKDHEDFYAIIDKAVENGCRNFDTAPSYRAEKILGSAVNRSMVKHQLNRSDYYIQTKIDAWQMQDSDGDIDKYIFKALDLLGTEYLDSLLVHWPIPEYLEKTWRACQRLKSENIVKNIGICNVRARHLEKYMSNGIHPDIVQIERHPLMVFQKELELFKINNIHVQAYSPLCKMHVKLKESSALQEISERYNKSIGQIVLRWHIDTSVAPVFTSSKQSRVAEYLDVFSFSLTNEDVLSISALNENYKLCLESFACPGF